MKRTREIAAPRVSPDRYLTMRDVTERLPLHRTTIYKLIRAGTFPSPVQLSPGRSAFRERDVDQYLANCRPGITRAAALGIRPSPPPAKRRAPRAR